MVFEKYRARKAYAKELRSISITELELEHKKLRNPFPPSYDDLYRDHLGRHDQPASPRSSVSSGSASSSTQSSRSASPYQYIPQGQQQHQQRRQGNSSGSNRSSYASSNYTTTAASTTTTGTTERTSFHSRSGSDASTRS